MAISEGQEVMQQKEEEIVTCHFVADDWIDEVYYNNEYVRDKVKYASTPPLQEIKEFIFTPKEGGVLAIATNDTESGTSAVFCFKCKSTDPNSYWNFELDINNVRLYEVRVYGIVGSDENIGPMKRSSDKVPHIDWYKNDFNDSSWEVPTVATNDFVAKSHDLEVGNGVWYKEYKYTFFRFNPQKVCLASLEKKRQQKLRLDKEVSSLMMQHGYNILDMKIQMNIDDDIENMNHPDANLEGEVVTCNFVADGKIDAVYYGDKDERDHVQNVDSPTHTVKTFVFTPKSNDVLAISAKAKAFGFQCTSTNPDSYWNFNLDCHNCRLYEVRSSDGQNQHRNSITEYLSSKQQKWEWYMKSFDDSSWEYPTQPSHAFITKFHHMSRIWYKDSTCAFFRFNPQKVDIDRLAKERKEREALSDTVSTMAKKYGYNIVGFKVQKNENPDVNITSEKANLPIKDDRPINRKILTYVADHITNDWKRLGRNLNLDEPKVDEIESDHVSTYERALKCQHAWIRMNRTVSWADLRTALVNVPRNDIVRDVEEKFNHLIIGDFDNGRKQTVYTKRKFDIDTSTRLDPDGDRNRFPKIYPGTLIDGLEEVRVAAKTFYIENEEHRKKLQNNANIMYELRRHAKCNNIVNIIDIYHEESKQFILILERCDFDMKQYLDCANESETSLSETKRKLIAWTKTKISALQIAREILDGLEYVHSNHHGSTFMHRDIKPSNILFRIDGEQITVKISDFGISKRCEFSRNFTTTCPMKGTDLYMPNDITEKGKGGKELAISDLKMADMFAVGITLHQLLTNGRHPFEGKSDARTKVHIEDGERTELFDMENKITLNLIYNLTEPNPNDRLNAPEVKSYHPWFFDHTKIIAFLKELYATLSDSNVDANLKKEFEESRTFANDGDWRKRLPEVYIEKMKDNSSYPGVSLVDQVKFILEAIDHFADQANNTFTKLIFGKNLVSDAEIVAYLINGETPLFPSFFIYVYCKAQVFPNLELVKNTGAKKIRESYNRYIEDLKKTNPQAYSSMESECTNNITEIDPNCKGGLSNWLRRKFLKSKT